MSNDPYVDAIERALTVLAETNSLMYTLLVTRLDKSGALSARDFYQGLVASQGMGLFKTAAKDDKLAQDIFSRYIEMLGWAIDGDGGTAPPAPRKLNLAVIDGGKQD